MTDANQNQKKKVSSATPGGSKSSSQPSISSLAGEKAKSSSLFNHDFSKIPANGNGSKTPTPKTLWINPAHQEFALDPSLFVRQSKAGYVDDVWKRRGSKTNETEVNQSIESDLVGQTVRTKTEVVFPWTIGQPLPPFEPNFFYVKEFKAEMARGPGQTPAGAVQDNVYVSAGLKGLWYEFNDLKADLPGLEDLGVGATVEASSDLIKGFARPDVTGKVGIEASYQLWKSPVYVQAAFSYDVTIPYHGKATVTPNASFGFTIKFP